MSKRASTILGILIIIVLFAGAACLFACNPPDHPDPPEPSITTITELNQPYEGSVLRITATEIETINYPSGGMVVSIKFVVENVSKSESRLIWGNDMEGYIDDVATSQTFIIGYPDLIGQTIAPGKRAEGYYCLPCSKDAKIIEVRIRDAKYSEQFAVFVFDIPPVE